MGDGGRTALGGFLWQAMAVLGLAVRPLIEKDPGDGGELDAIVDLVAKGGTIRHEYFDQDAMVELGSVGLKGDDQRVLLQFKYSSQPTPPSLSERDLAEIVTSLQNSAARATAAGQPITAFALITNRHVASAESAAKCHGRPLSDMFEHIIGGTPFRIITRINEDMWQSWLYRIGRRYGCNKTEVQSGVHKLIGQLFEATRHGEDALLRPETVIEAITGFPDARPLEAIAINAREAARFDHMVEAMGLVGDVSRRDALDDLTVRRDALDDLARQAISRGIIAVVGQGGTGKTVALGQWIHACRERGRTVAVLRHASAVNNEHYLAREARGWATDGDSSLRSADTLPTILARLALANGEDVRPVFVLALDGLDHVHLRAFAPQIQAILREFSDEEGRASNLGLAPRATIMITCRDADELKEYLPVRDLSGFGLSQEKQCGIVDMGLFSWHELRRAAARLADPVRRRVEDLVGASQLADSALPQPLESANLTLKELHPDASPAPLSLGLSSSSSWHMPAPPEASSDSVIPIHLLRYPVLWRAFLLLEQSEQEGFLMGDAEALPRLARQYVGRFCSKAAERISGLRREEVADALVPVAGVCLAGGQHLFDRAIFLERVMASGVVQPPHDRALYEEALSAGVITREARSRWRWTHGFVCAYLAAFGSDDLPSGH